MTDRLASDQTAPGANWSDGVGANTKGSAGGSGGQSQTTAENPMTESRLSFEGCRVENTLPGISSLPDQRTTDDKTTDRDDDLVTLPRWVAGVLAEELSSYTDCDGSVASCPRCEAIRIASEAYQRGQSQTPADEAEPLVLSRNK